MLLRRLHIKLEHCAAEDLYAVVEMLHKIYAAKIIGMHLVLPASSDPPEVVRCVALVRMEPEIPIGHEIVQLVATKLIGSMKVVPKKRGVSIEVVYAKKKNFANGAAFKEELHGNARVEGGVNSVEGGTLARARLFGTVPLSKGSKSRRTIESTTARSGGNSNECERRLDTR
jgi:hypothetical protein